MKIHKLITIGTMLLLTLFFVNVNTYALSPETEVLVNLLVKKGIITKDDAAALKQEVETVTPETVDKETIKQEITAELKTEGGILSGIQDNITISGAVEADYQFRDHRDRTDPRGLYHDL